MAQQTKQANQQPQSADPPQQKTQRTGGSDNIWFLIAYVLTWLSGVFVYITEGQKNKRLKFHAMQAILLGIGGFIITLILDFVLVFVFFPLAFLGWLIGLLLWLYGLYVGYQAYSSGKDVEIPFIGPIARQYSK